MSKVETQRMGRLMAAGWGILQIVAKTPWLLVLILPIIGAITYDGGYRRDRFVKVVARGSVTIILSGMDVTASLRPTANGKGSIFSLTMCVPKTKYAWGLGIA